MKLVILSFILFLVLCIPQIRHGLEASMIGQMLIQIPFLALAGYLFGVGIRKHMSSILSQLNSQGIPGLLIVIFTCTYWILPRSLDAPLNSVLFEAIKYVTVPLLIGLPLALSWGMLAFTIKGFVWANVISMNFVMGWFYANSPIRLCNNYLTEQQLQLGIVLMATSGILLFFFFWKFFLFGTRNIH